MSFLEIKGLDKSFGGLRAVNNVSFSFEQGIIKGVIGPNGAGKTTLFNLIAGSLRCDSGSILFKGSEICGLPQYKIAGMGMTRTFQNIKIFTGMTVLENVMVGAHVRTSSGFVSSMLGLPSSRRENSRIYSESMEILEFLNISDLADHDAKSISFGKQRIVEFARALASSPELILFDEPAAGLNLQETSEIAALIKTINSQGVSVLIIDHDMSLMMDICGEIAVLSSGEKIAEGMPSEIQKNREVISVYLGEEDA